MPAVACELADGQLAGFHSRERIGFMGHSVCDRIAKPEPISNSHIHWPSSSSTLVSSFSLFRRSVNGEPLSTVIDESNGKSLRQYSYTGSATIHLPNVQLNLLLLAGGSWHHLRKKLLITSSRCPHDMFAENTCVLLKLPHLNHCLLLMIDVADIINRDCCK